MEIFEVINTRRSIRDYIDKPIPQELIEKILKAAMQAPSAGNQQPWHFILVRHPQLRKSLAEALPYGKMLTRAPLGIVVCGDLSLEKHPGCWVQDCSAAVQNMLLAAHASGLGAVWVGVYPENDRVVGVKQCLKLPDEVIPLCVVAIGYPAVSVHAIDRFRPERVHEEHW